MDMTKYNYDYRKIADKELYDYINENSAHQHLVMYDKPANNTFSMPWLKN
jgi:hypothetical protein